VLPHIVNEMRARRLIKISHPASKQREFGVLEFRQIEREGDFSLEPGFTVCRSVEINPLETNWPASRRASLQSR